MKKSVYQTIMFITLILSILLLYACLYQIGYNNFAVAYLLEIASLIFMASAIAVVITRLPKETTLIYYFVIGLLLSFSIVMSISGYNAYMFASTMNLEFADRFMIAFSISLYILAVIELTLAIIRKNVIDDTEIFWSATVIVSALLINVIGIQILLLIVVGAIPITLRSLES